MKPCQHPANEQKDGCRVCHLYAFEPAYNKLWGGDGIHQGPDTWTRARNFTLALARHVADGGRLVEEPILAMRKQTCERCDYFKPQSRTCAHNKCGCFVDTKAAWASEDCPANRWIRTRPSVRFDHHNLCPPVSGLRFNPSIVACPEGGYLFCFRNGWEGSSLFMVRLNDQFEPGESWPLHIDHPESGYGREDPRLFWHNGRLHVSLIGVSYGGNHFHTSQLYARLSADYRVEKSFCPHWSGRSAWEKNWAFFSHDGQLYAVYSIAPHRVLRIDDHQAALVHETPNLMNWSGGEMRGGAAPVLHEGEWYHFFHDRVTGINGKQQYRTGLYTFKNEPPFTISRYIPEPIIVADPTTNVDNYADVAFVGGAVLQNGEWILAHGNHDRFATLDFLSAASLERRLISM